MVCHSCSMELQDDFNYCPYCGSEIDRNAEFRQIVDQSFTRLEEVVQIDAITRLESLSNRLESMEEELELFLATGRGCN